MGSVSESHGSAALLFLLTITISTFLLPSVGASALTATPGSFTLSNTIIDVGQISVANTVISGGSGGPYAGQWSEFNANQINNQVIAHLMSVEVLAEMFLEDFLLRLQCLSYSSQRMPEFLKG